MNDALDEIDRRLREYAPRWRAAQPPPPAVDPARLRAGERTLFRRPRIVRPTGQRRAAGRLRRWGPALAVAAAVAVLAAGIAVIRSHSARPAPQPAATPSATPGVVAWAPLPASGSGVPVTTVPPSPDPAGADGLPSCRAAQLRVSTVPTGAGGTRYLVLAITSTARCRLGGYPTVTALDRGGHTLAVPVQRDASTGQYDHPVAVGGGAAATLRLSWSNAWCAAEITIAKLRVDLPEGGGSVTTEGFGTSICYGTPGSGGKAPITVGVFTPQDYTPARAVTAFDGVSAQVAAPASVAASGRLRFVVTLTAPAGRDVPLDPCPDYKILFGGESGSTAASHALNCAAVPYRDTAGRPYLPAGIPVRFDMQADTPQSAAPAAKLVWQLDISDTVAAGTAVEIR
jgi:hypothetical protein